MISAFPSLLPFLVGLAVGQPVIAQQSVTRLVVDDQVVLRVPVDPRPRLRKIQWVERRGPGCIASGNIRRALLSSPDQVDFVMASKRRIRAKFDDDCPGIDFYGGFYLEVRDRMVCAGRDSVHSRMGGRCTIGTFHQLLPRLAEGSPKG